MSREDNIRYVAAGNPTGWAAMAKTIREVDEDKVMDYKEDIDTLLVFTGLFSAVLTAFVTVSYASLFPDKQDTIIQLLGQIATQTNSHTITTIVNSTIPPQSSSSSLFEPSLATLRVNYLWFASLVVTLITASFSMLVKQWLREYLAFEYTSPRERLRARQFRHPGLITWKVYEIAGFLPLLLQLALGLFLLGLCFFTWSEEHGIGTMCAVLVGLWAALFVSATIAPISSARCPYKTALLKRIIVALRRHFRHYLYPSSMAVGVRALSSSMTLGVVSDHRLQLRLARSLLEEPDAVKQDTDEIAILGEVDSFLLDDDLLGTTILDSLVQNYTSPPDVIKFVLQAIALRIRGNELTQLTQPLTSPPDLRRLTKGAWIAVSDIVASTILSGMRLGAAPSGSWVKDAICLLFATSERPLTPRAIDALIHCVQKSTLPYIVHTLDNLSSLATTAGRLHIILDPISTRLIALLSQRQIQPEDVVVFVASLLKTETREKVPPLPLKSILDLGSVSAPVWQFCSDVLGAMIEDALGPERNPMDIGPWLEDTIHLLLSFSSYPLTSQGNKALAQLCLAKSPYGRLGACIRPLASPNNEDFRHILSRCHEVCKHVTVDNSAHWLLKEITFSIPCTARCTHGVSASLAWLVVEHASQPNDWLNYFVSLMIESSRTILTVDGSWPPGSTASLLALMSLPTTYHAVNPEVPRVLLHAIRDLRTSPAALESLISVDPIFRRFVVPDAALVCVVSLISNASTEDRRKFIQSVSAACNGYLSENDRSAFRWIGSISPVRHVALLSLIHRAVESDRELFYNWVGYYKTCAKAISTFKSVKYSSLLDDEKAHTTSLAEECLLRLDFMEPGADSREANLNVSSSLFPDEIFQELAAFVTDVDAMAQKCKRIRRLQRIGALPSSTKMTNDEAGGDALPSGASDGNV